MANRYGTVLVFRKDVRKDEIEAAMDSIRDVLEPVYLAENKVMREAGINVTYRLEKFDDEYGGPVWYVP